MSKVKRSLKLRDFYRSYRLRCKESGTKPKPWEEYRKVLLTMGEVMSSMLLTEGIIALPWYVGDVFFKKKNEGPVKDRKLSKEYKKEVFQFNEHTEGYIYELFWLSAERFHKKRILWRFSGERTMKRNSAELFQTGQVKYPDFKMMNKRAM